MFLRELATAILLPLAAGLLVAIVFAPTAVPIRSEASLRATPFASFQPEGALLVNDSYLGRIGKSSASAVIWRVYVTDDGAQFQRAFIDLARVAGAELLYGNRSPIPLSELRTYDTRDGTTFGAATQGTFTSIVFSQRGPIEAGGRAWRWQVTIRIKDGP